VKPKYTVVGIGELLWDVFRSGKQLGGAPANFAYVTSVLGDCGVVASRMGSDELGDEAKRKLTELGLECEYVQQDPQHATGTVRVWVDAGGQPKFEITESVAWDFLAWTEQYEDLAAQTDAVCFGSLAQRSSESRNTIVRFLNAIPGEACIVFDVNLRQHFFSAENIRNSLQLADIVKLNHEELPRVMELAGLGNAEMHAAMEYLFDNFDLSLICVTRGEKGSVLRTRDTMDEHPGVKIHVKDTVGAGDAFTAGLVHCYLRRTSLKIMNEVANQMGAWVASNVGATPPRASAPRPAVITDRDS